MKLQFFSLVCLVLSLSLVETSLAQPSGSGVGGGRGNRSYNNSLIEKVKRLLSKQPREFREFLLRIFRETDRQKEKGTSQSCAVLIRESERRLPFTAALREKGYFPLMIGDDLFDSEFAPQNGDWLGEFDSGENQEKILQVNFQIVRVYRLEPRLRSGYLTRPDFDLTKSAASQVDFFDPVSRKTLEDSSSDAYKKTYEAIIKELPQCKVLQAQVFNR